MDIRNQASNIIDAICKFGEAVDKHIEIKRLLNQNLDLQLKCGSCQLWMTQQCPREARGVKVHCNQNICDKFKMCSLTQKLIDENIAKVRAIEESLNIQE